MASRWPVGPGTSLWSLASHRDVIQGDELTWANCEYMRFARPMLLATRPGGGQNGLPAEGFPVRLYSVTGPEARMIRWKATGGSVFEHVPPDFAKIARRFAW